MIIMIIIFPLRACSHGRATPTAQRPFAGTLSFPSISTQHTHTHTHRPWIPPARFQGRPSVGCRLGWWKGGLFREREREREREEYRQWVRSFMNDVWYVYSEIYTHTYASIIYSSECIKVLYIHLFIYTHICKCFIYIWILIRTFMYFIYLSTCTHMHML